jgi:hypothetical protein
MMSNLKSVEDNKAKAEAIDWLKHARKVSPTTGVELHIQYVRQLVKKAGCSLEEIGTSEQELKQLLLVGYTAEVNKWIKLARETAGKKGEDNIVYFLRHMNENVEKAGHDLAYFGISEQEVASLFKKGNKAQAKSWLRIAKKKGAKHTCEEMERFKTYIREYVKKAGCTLKDIGTSKKEFAKLFLK